MQDLVGVLARRYKGKEMADLRRSSSFCIVENSASWLWRSSFPPKLSAAVATARHSLSSQESAVSLGSS